DRSYPRFCRKLPSRVISARHPRHEGPSYLRRVFSRRSFTHSYVMPRLMPLSFRAQLTLVLVAFSLVLTSALGWVAYRTSQGIIEREAIRSVGIAANAREQALLRLLHRQVDRADNFLRIARL